MIPLTRRQFVHRAFCGLATMPFLRIRMAGAAERFVPLREVAAARGLTFGFALDAAKLAQDEVYRALVMREASIVVPENALKWATVHPEPERYHFAPADSIATFAKAHDQRMRGHAFCWHRALPDWLLHAVTPANAEAVLTMHINTVARHYRGQIVSWDVVNEAIQVEDGLPGGMRHAFWYQMLGERYVDLAFHAAHEADPDAVLCYNDYGLENDGHYGDTKRSAVLAMLQGLRQRGVPVHALGIQSHLRAGEVRGFGAGLSRFILAVRDLGLSVLVTELDVDDSRLTGSMDERDDIVAATYKRYLEVVLATRAVSTVITWGVWDTPHRTGATPGNGPLAQRPLAFGPEGQIKPASWAIAHCLAR
ncbi:endo-1,4-beta-xylanase [Robbsia andropogonis]|uniref:endo-1,4-beta-xylanase n=2 Tax=Robbsia andropogonis TaxID=28092 RepID=UPI0004675D29